MKKSDLKQNMIVETRYGDRYLVLENVDTLLHRGRLFFMSNNGFLSDGVYSEELSDRHIMSPFDIVKVMKWKQFKGLECLNAATIDEFEVLWERPEPINWQSWELEVLKHIPSCYRKIYNESGKFYLHGEKKGSTWGLGLGPDLPSLSKYKYITPYWIDIDEELKRYHMERKKNGDTENVAGNL